MSIFDAMHKLFGGRSGADIAPADLVSRLRDEHGSVRAAGRAVGIPEATLRRWAKGGQPSARAVERVERARRDVTSRRHNEGTFVLEIKDRQVNPHTGAQRVRRLRAEQLQLRPGALERARELYVRGDTEAAARVFLSGVGNDFYRGWLTPGSTLARTGTSDGSGGGPEGAALRRLWDDQAGGGGAGAASGGTGGGSGYDAADDGGDWWDDVSHEGWDDVESDYGAVITGGAS